MSSQDKNLLKVLDFIGLAPDVIPLDKIDHLLDQDRKSSQRSLFAVLASCETVHDLMSINGINDRPYDAIGRLAQAFFIYGFDTSPNSLEVARKFSDDLISGITLLDGFDSRYRVSSNARDICGPFSGLTIDPINPDQDYAFIIDRKSHVLDELIAIDDFGLFLKFDKHGTDVFLLACESILDISLSLENRPGQDVLDIRRYFSRIIPLLMYLKHIFGEAIWHSNTAYASLIIDDPLLKPTYGHLDFRKLLDLAIENNFFATVAFIPWNYQRTSPEVSEMFVSRADKLSICIHGNDHDENEFGIDDVQEINRKVKLAKSRMEDHRQRTGINHDEVMIFPQGRFSRQSMRVLKLNGLLAAVNSGIIPFGEDYTSVQFSDFLNLSLTKYSSFPLFTRRYPSDDVVNFAFDIFIGKPCLIVVHQDYFKDGYDGLVNFIHQINVLDDSLRWVNLAQIVRQIHEIRKVPGQPTELRMYSKILHLENKSDRSKIFNVIKYETDNAAIRKISVNGKETRFSFDGDNKISIPLEIGPGQELEITVDYNDPYGKLELDEKFGDRVKTYLRRHLSEFRDNVLSKNDRLSGLASRIRKTLT